LHFDQAEQEFKRSIELQPKQTEAYYELGEVFLNENKLQESLPEFQKVLERSPRHGGALVGVGEAYFKLKLYEQARDWLLKATMAAPSYQPGHYYLGLTLARMGQADESRKELDVATQLAAKDNKQAASRLQMQEPGGQP
jgi:tetratricopeptide (TPR) repeat protein